MLLKTSTLIVSLALVTVYVNAQTNTFPASGNAGIGTISPAAKLEISDSSSSSTSILQFSQKRDVLGTVGALKFNVSGTEVGRIESERMVSGNRLSAMKFFVRTDSGTVEAMRLSHTGMLGLGVSSPSARFQVNTPQGTVIAKFTQTNLAESLGYLQIENGTQIGGAYIPAIHGKSYATTRPYGLMMIGEAEDLTPTAADTVAGAIVLDGRSKNSSRLSTNNIFMVNSYGNNLMAVKGDGSVGIGTVNTKGYKLAVNGSMIATKMTVKNFGSWPDFVFEKDYELASLTEVERFVKENKHLPGMPTAAEVAEKGVDVGAINQKLLQKVEELTLYIIEQQKMIRELQEMMKKN
ncbi:hypothetical protein [Chitinophaga silvisoli]|uniref:Tail fiber domain-containing protein n=1 Tax=Chitinophaga silvisoli TaxID=2291814 RepID=A0A3E1P9G5_9BACT|nr:hypothetical protein [Chitinophaga silvisoli]RFM36836.1 hypothetical protein DXN04_04875 [Chitinophaga silvisoli]